MTIGNKNLVAPSTCPGEKSKYFIRPLIQLTLTTDAFRQFILTASRKFDITYNLNTKHICSNICELCKRFNIFEQLYCTKGAFTNYVRRK